MKNQKLIEILDSLVNSNQINIFELNLIDYSGLSHEPNFKIDVVYTGKVQDVPYRLINSDVLFVQKEISPDYNVLIHYEK